MSNVLVVPKSWIPQHAEKVQAALDRHPEIDYVIARDGRDHHDCFAMIRPKGHESTLTKHFNDPKNVGYLQTHNKDVLGMWLGRKAFRFPKPEGFVGKIDQYKKAKIISYKSKKAEHLFVYMDDLDEVGHQYPPTQECVVIELNDLHGPFEFTTPQPKEEKPSRIRKTKISGLPEQIAAAASLTQKHRKEPDWDKIRTEAQLPRTQMTFNFF